MRMHALMRMICPAVGILASLSSLGRADEPAKDSLTNANASQRSVIFFDDFLGASIDPTKWTILDRLSDQTNKEVNCVVPQNVSIKDGLLEGVSKHEDHSCGDSVEPTKTMHYTSWQIQQATEPFLYGTIEVRAKVPGGIGTWPAIWMLGFEWQASQPHTANKPGHRWPNAGWCEIDIAEFMQGARRKVNTTVHYREQGGTHFMDLPFDAATQFAVYRLEWTQGALAWSVDAEDGKGFRALYSVRGSKRVPNVPMYLVINAAIGGIGGGEPDPSTFPQTFQVDYVRVTQ
jgi:beta-glucanase (GH16 family)